MASSKDFGDIPWRITYVSPCIWHINYVHPCLKQHYQKLLPQNKDAQASNTRIFLPLCGKTLDMIWLAYKGLQVVGVEPGEQAIVDFFKENNIAHDVKTMEGSEGIKCYSSLDRTKDISIYQMDVFKVTTAILGGAFDAIWDRASLSTIGLYIEDRGRRYADIFLALLRPNGRYMIENNVYHEDPGVDSLPTHVPESTLKNLFGKAFDITPLEVDLSEISQVKQPFETFDKEFFLLIAKSK